MKHQFYTEDKVIPTVATVCSQMYVYNIATLSVYDNIIFAVVVCLFCLLYCKADILHVHLFLFLRVLST